jgi:hypothetical protein
MEIPKEHQANIAFSGKWCTFAMLSVQESRI